MKIIFDKKSGRIEFNGESILLTNQGKICLEFLILNEGVVVSKDGLHSECWKKYGIVVSDVTVRQTMYRIRKAFVSIGVNFEVILTSGRSGYMLVPGVIIVHDNYEKPNDTSSDINTPNEEKPNNFNSPIKRTRKTFTLIISVLFVISFILIGFFFRFYQVINIVEYQPITEVKGFYFYIQNEYGEQNQDQNPKLSPIVLYWLEQQKVNSSDWPKIYITNHNLTTISFYACNKDIGRLDSKCKSFVIIRTVK